MNILKEPPFVCTDAVPLSCVLPQAVILKGTPWKSFGQETSGDTRGPPSNFTLPCPVFAQIFLPGTKPSIRFLKPSFGDIDKFEAAVSQGKPDLSLNERPAIPVALQCVLLLVNSFIN